MFFAETGGRPGKRSVSWTNGRMDERSVRRHTVKRTIGEANDQSKSVMRSDVNQTTGRSDA